MPSNQTVPSHAETTTEVPRKIQVITGKLKKPWPFELDSPPIGANQMVRYKPTGADLPGVLPVFEFVDGQLRHLNADLTGSYTVVG